MNVKSMMVLAAMTVAMAAANAAELKLRNVYADHMVFQRGEPIVLVGTGTPDGRVKAKIDGTEVAETIGKNGGWKVELPAMKAGGPYEITICDDAKCLSIKDVMIGELWLCSGQSNMEMPVVGGRFYSLPDGGEVARAANDPLLRLAVVAKATDCQGPHEEAKTALVWGKADNSKTVAGFSATGYFFGKELRKRLGDVAVGLVGAYWGGTCIEPWIPEKVLRRRGLAAVADSLEKTRSWTPPKDGATQVPDAVQDAIKTLDAWIAKVEQAGGAEAERARREWMKKDLDDSGWKVSESLAIPEPAFVWYRWHLDTAELRNARFEANWISDIDEAWLDGEKIGFTDIRTRNHWSAYRKYPIASLKAGKHVLVIRAQNHMGDGGISSPKIIWDGGMIDLAKEKVLVKTETKPDAKTGPRPSSPWDLGDPNADPRGSCQVPTTLFNTMIAPLDAFRFRGAIWYQGCSNTGNPQPYADYQAALVDGWRETFSRPDLAFVCVQLAGFISQRPANRMTDEQIAALEPTENGYVELRAKQEEIRKVDGCECVTAVDIGDHSDIHPRFKPEVGRRLAAAAANLCYGAKEPVRGPKAVKATRKDSAVEIEFDSPVTLKDGKIGPHEFTLAGSDGRRCWAEAKQLAPNTVSVAAAAVKEPVKVDYARQPYTATMSLYNASGFPVTPFVLEVK